MLARSLARSPSGRHRARIHSCFTVAVRRARIFSHTEEAIEGLSPVLRSLLRRDEKSSGFRRQLSPTPRRLACNDARRGGFSDARYPRDRSHMVQSRWSVLPLFPLDFSSGRRARVMRPRARPSSRASYGNARGTRTRTRGGDSHGYLG